MSDIAPLLAAVSLSPKTDKAGDALSIIPMIQANPLLLKKFTATLADTVRNDIFLSALVTCVLQFVSFHQHLLV